MTPDGPKARPPRLMFVSTGVRRWILVPIAAINPLLPQAELVPGHGTSRAHVGHAYKPYPPSEVSAEGILDI